MQLSFDPRDRNAATAALAVVLAIHPDITFHGSIELTDDPQVTTTAQEAFGTGPTAQPTADIAAAPAGSTPTPNSAPAPASSPNAAPVAPAPSGGDGAPANPGNVELDSKGVPWDGRIHASTKSTIADGSWRKKVGVTAETVAVVEAELRAALGAPAAPVPPAPAPAAAPPPPPPVAPAPAPTAVPPAPPPTPAGASTESGPAVATTAPSGPLTFAGLMKRITTLQAAGTLTVEGTQQISQALGITGVRDLVTRPDLIESFDALLPGQS